MMGNVTIPATMTKHSSKVQEVGKAAVRRLRSLLALPIIIAIFSQLSPVYLSWNNLVTMTEHVSVTAILAVGMTYVIITGGIDLSVGAIAGFSGIVAGYLIGTGITLGNGTVFLPSAVVTVIAIVAGGLVGTFNGLVITRLRIPPFIATLGMLYVARGAALLISGGHALIELSGSAAHGNIGFDYLGSADWFHIPVEIYIMVAVAGLGALVAARTTFGRRVYAIGGNERAAKSAGLRVARLKVIVYMLSGACAGIAGVLMASELSAADPTAGSNYELRAIAAVVLGGTSLFGGEGTVGGSIAGAFVIGFLNDGLVLANVSQFWQMVATGLVIIAAVAIDEFQRTGGNLIQARRRLKLAQQRARV